ncbi:ROK family protein, partial [Streptococcus suis]
TPYETFERTEAFFKRFVEDVAGVAIGSFGPIDIDPNSTTYGYITKTPKEHWSNVDLVGLISKEFKVPFYFTTDVNSSAYG